MLNLKLSNIVIGPSEVRATRGATYVDHYFWVINLFLFAKLSPNSSFSCAEFSFNFDFIHTPTHPPTHPPPRESSFQASQA
jgi:hypothetical protein